MGCRSEARRRRPRMIGGATNDDEIKDCVTVICIVYACGSHLNKRSRRQVTRDIVFLTCPCVHVRLPLQPCIFSQATAFRILACSPKRTLLMCSPLGALWAHACRFHACSNRRAHASRVRVRVQPVIQPWFIVCGKSCACFSFERITTNIFVQHI